MFTIFATIPNCESEDGPAVCFDPNVIVRRLMSFFPELEITEQDYCKHVLSSFQEIEASDRTIQAAENDVRRRSPVICFRWSTAGQQIIRGQAERYSISISSDQPIPENMESQVLEVLKTIKYVPVTIYSGSKSGSPE